MTLLHKIPKLSRFELTEFSHLAFSDPSNDDGAFKILKICSGFLLLALTVVVIVLVYFVKKKVRLATQHKDKPHARTTAGRKLSLCLQTGTAV